MESVKTTFFWSSSKPVKAHVSTELSLVFIHPFIFSVRWLWTYWLIALSNENVARFKSSTSWPCCISANHFATTRGPANCDECHICSLSCHKVEDHDSLRPHKWCWNGSGVELGPKIGNAYWHAWCETTVGSGKSQGLENNSSNYEVIWPQLVSLRYIFILKQLLSNFNFDVLKIKDNHLFSWKACPKTFPFKTWPKPDVSPAVNTSKSIGCLIQ